MPSLFFARLERAADHLATVAAVDATFRAMADARDVPLADLGPVSARDAGRIRRGQGDLLAAADARCSALYLAVTHFNRPQRAVARAASVTVTAISKALRRVEDRRAEDAAIDRQLDEIELGLLECAA